MSNTPGTLYVVATPIGNLEDLSPRARLILNQADIIIAEDTRHSRKMFSHFNITGSIYSYHDHNERRRTPRLIERLQAGASVALISDAGTPLICDPGYHLVNAAHAAGITVSPIPGPSALLGALSASGFPATQFTFEGFMPAKKNMRRKRLRQLAEKTETLVFYESPRRIIACLEDAVEHFGGERQALIAKELSKRHECVKRGRLTDLVEWLKSDPAHSKGEFVIAVQGSETSAPEESETKRILEILLVKCPIKEAVQLTAAITGAKKSAVYRLAMTLNAKR